ncbi:MAG: proton-conducting transporter membrane subunit [Dermatophilaceae bacterium]
MRVAVDWLTLAPVLAPALGALLVLLVDAVVPRARPAPLAISLIGLGAGIGVAGWAAAGGGTVRSLCLDAPEGACLYAAPPMASILQIAALGAAVVVILMLLADRSGSDEPLTGGAAVSAALVLAASAGATGVVAAQDLGSWLVTLELATLPMVALVALAARREAVHGALTLLVTSVLSFALLALGVALWVIATGSSTFATSGVRDAWASPEHRLVLVAAVLVLLAGLGFKLSLVPFHAWTPVTYVGAALPVTLALATVSKIAALGALITVVRALASVVQDPAPTAVILAFAAVALVSMLLGAVVALRQVDPVRLLAWSAIGQAGWVVLPLAAVTAAAADAAAGYLAAYVVATTVAFAVVHLVHGPVAAGSPARPRELSHTGGLARTHAILGGVLVLALLSLAGLPPGIVGLVAKIVALQPVVAAGLWPVAVVAVVGAVLGVAVYLRWVAILLGAGRSPGPLQRMVGSRAGLGLAAAALVVTSLLPGLIFR